jgi:tRNA pseudouridine38-40 synthase
VVTKLTFEYDGTGFAGWARQPGLRTVQEELERALRTVLGQSPGPDGEPLSITVAGRTDRGVHAWGQVASYPHEAIDPQRLNSLLPDDIAVLLAEPAVEGFDARHDAHSRTYCYRVLLRPTRAVFARGRALWWPRELDRAALGQCAAMLVGVHDFTAFTPTETEHVRFERKVLRAGWHDGTEQQPRSPRPAQAPLPAVSRLGAGSPLRDPLLAGAPVGRGELLEFWIEADTFMRHMNRVLVGTMLEVASGRRTPEDFGRLLEGCPRSEAGPTAPAHGLALASVSYS